MNWLRLTELDCPYAGTGTDIKRIHWAFQRRQIESVTEGDFAEVVLEVESILFHLMFESARSFVRAALCIPHNGICAPDRLEGSTCRRGRLLEVSEIFRAFP